MTCTVCRQQPGVAETRVHSNPRGVRVGARISAGTCSGAQRAGTCQHMGCDTGGHEAPPGGRGGALAFGKELARAPGRAGQGCAGMGLGGGVSGGFQGAKQISAGRGGGSGKCATVAKNEAVISAGICAGISAGISAGDPGGSLGISAGISAGIRAGICAGQFSAGQCAQH